MRTIRPANHRDRDLIATAVSELRAARDKLRLAGAVRAAGAAARAVKSAEGASRHVLHRQR